MVDKRRQIIKIIDIRNLVFWTHYATQHIYYKYYGEDDK